MDFQLLHLFPCEEEENIRSQKALSPVLGKDLAGSDLRVFTHSPRISPIIRLTVAITFVALISADLHSASEVCIIKFSFTD